MDTSGVRSQVAMGWEMGVRMRGGIPTRGIPTAGVTHASSGRMRCRIGGKKEKLFRRKSCAYLASGTP